MSWIIKQWNKYQRSKEISNRGWGSLGRILFHGQSWTEARMEREIRRSNRLYRLMHGQNPWKPYKGY